MSSISTSNVVEIRFLRSQEKASAKSDDILTFKPTSTYDVVTVSYQDRLSNTRSNTRMNYNDAMHYFETLLSVLEHDEEPYEAIQFTFPQYPSFYMAAKRVDDDVFETVKRMFYSTYRAWFFEDDSGAPYEVEECECECECDDDEEEEVKAPRCYCETHND